MITKSFIIDASIAGERLDKALAPLAEMSRSKLQMLIREGHAQINGKVTGDLSYLVAENDMVQLTIPPAKTVNIKPTAIPINIVYEDEDIIVIDKQAGLTVHPGAGNYDDTLVNALVGHYGKTLSQLGGVERPGIVHRLDRNTSGLMMVAKNDRAHTILSEAIAERKVARLYKALVWGHIVPPSGTITTNIARKTHDRTRMTVVQEPRGKIAITHYDTLSAWQHISLVECRLETGRTHQIRVHLSHVGHSVVGDPEYGHNGRKITHYCSGELKETITKLGRQALHAYKLEFAHPVTKEELSFISELPEDLAVVIDVLQG